MKKIFSFFLFIILIFLLNSCKDKDWLKEVPLDFYSPDNSYETPGDFDAAVVRLYDEVSDLYSVNTNEGRALYYPTDIAWDGISENHQLNSYKDALNPTTAEVLNTWKRLYQMIFDANVVIGRIDDPNIKFTSETDRKALKAEAMFFRAFAYQYLGIIYGGVPIVLQEIDQPKRDFVRSTREDVWNQCISDLQFATQNLPDVNHVKADGRLCQAAAYHLLSEIYIIKQDWDSAIAAASKVIDNPNFALMTHRFGSRKDEPGDVYWDLFRRDNQNRSSGNTEAIWVNQFEYEKPGGGNPDNEVWPRFLGPNYWKLKDDDGVNLFIGPTNQNGGRGIGWFVSTQYMRNDIWKDGSGDMRNSSYNIIRDIKADNPQSSYYGKYIVESGAIKNFPNVLDRWWSVIYAKVEPINNFPSDLILNPATGLTTNNANGTYSDNYIYRLAETYLLRAEAYLGKGDKTDAAADINKVRSRANAPLISASDVNIDFILDERARELAWETPRLLTLMRLNKLVERVKKYNTVTGDRILDYQNVWPIPEREIETNTAAKLEQNPGY